MDRHACRCGYVLRTALLVAILLPAAGCVSGLATALYLLGADKTEAEFPGLKHKKVALVCRSMTSLQYRDARVAKDLALAVGKLMTINEKKITVIDQQKVEKWADENTWDEYTEIGKAVGAQMVIGIDLEHFDIYEGQTLYQGKANVSINVYDCEHGDKLVFEKNLPQVVWPPNSCVPTSDKQPSQFRREFLHVLADRIGRHFYSFDPRLDYAQDAVAGR